MATFAGIEAGGTKFVCALGSGTGPGLRQRAELPTTDPEVTLGLVADWLSACDASLAGIGVASFGPVDLRVGSPTYGCLLSTPKSGWEGFDIVGFLRDRVPGVPIGLDTDVNAAALAEQAWGAAAGTACAMYLTVGTGIGGGISIDGRPLHGLMHPEVGHMRLVHDRRADPFVGTCPYHGDCWEGLAAGPAIERRWGRPGAELAPDHPAWDLEASYVAAGISNLALALSPERVVVGGGVGSAPGLLDKLRVGVERQLGGYLPFVSELGSFIVAPGLGRDSGVVGAVALGRRAALG